MFRIGNTAAPAVRPQKSFWHRKRKWDNLWLPEGRSRMLLLSSLRFGDRSLTTGDVGQDFEDFVREALSLEDFRTRPLIAAGRKGVDGGIDLVPGGIGAICVVECKAIEEDKKAEARWAEVERHLSDNLPNDPALAPVRLAPYAPWANADRPIIKYWFCASSTFANEAERQKLETRITAFFERKCQARPEFAHLAGLRATVRDWNDFRGFLNRYPTLRYKWFKTLFPRGLRPIETAAQENSFRSFLFEGKLPFFSRSDYLAEVGSPSSQAALQEDERILNRFRSGEGSGLVLHGPGGVGKTRLALEVVRQAERENQLAARVELSANYNSIVEFARADAQPKNAVLLIDYAEAHPNLSEIAEALTEAGGEGHRIRFVATCRNSAFEAVRSAFENLEPFEVALAKKQQPNRRLEFPRFDGHILTMRGECPDAENEEPVPAEFREQIVALARAGVALRTWPGSSSRARRRSMAGSSRPIAMVAAAPTV